MRVVVTGATRNVGTSAVFSDATGVFNISAIPFSIPIGSATCWRRDR